MTITQIEYFIAVAECQNISKAAEQLYITQPALSRQITAMEEELDMHLFFRKSRPITLTPAGELLYRGLKSFPDQYYEMVQKAQVLESGMGGFLNVGVLPGIDVGDFFPNVLFTMKERYPDIDMNMSSASFSDLMAGVRQFSYDFVITYDFGVESAPGIQSLVIDDCPNYMAISKYHPLAGRDHYSLSDFKEELFIVNASDDLDGGDKVLSKCQAAGFTPKYRQAEDLNQYMLLVEAGIGVAVLNGRTSLRHSPDIQFVPLEDIDSNKLMLVWDEENLNPSVKKGLEIFQFELDKA